MDEVRRVIEEAAPELAGGLAEAMLAAWLDGGASAALGVLPEAKGVMPEGVSLPGVEASVAALRERKLLDRPTFQRAATAIQRQAFTVAGVASMEALEKARSALIEDVGMGGTLREFREAVSGTILDASHIETVYRTNVAVAQAQGQDAILAHPMVDDEFPYIETVPIDDSRLSELCEAVSNGGLDNTGVFRRDDPAWRRYMPPRHFNCRCAAIPLTLEDAAAKGVREAQQWLDSGLPPAHPKHIDPSSLPPLPKGWVPPGEPVRMSQDFDEGKHKRDDGGKFTAGSGGKKAAARKPARAIVGQTLRVREGERESDVQVKKVEDGKVHIGYADSQHTTTSMPEESFHHFVNDLAGKVDVPPSDNPSIEAVRAGQAEFLGKGDDGLAFRAGDKAVKVSTTVPHIPTNPGHRTPAQAAEMLRHQTEVSEEMRAAGVPGILPVEFVAHGDKGFQIRPYVEIPDKPTKDQLDDVAAKLKAMHAAGYAMNDEPQWGIVGGKVFFYDTGKAAKLPDDERQRKNATELDESRLAYAYRKAGLPEPQREPQGRPMSARDRMRTPPGDG